MFTIYLLYFAVDYFWFNLLYKIYKSRSDEYPIVIIICEHRYTSREATSILLSSCFDENHLRTRSYWFGVIVDNLIDFLVVITQTWSLFLNVIGCRHYLNRYDDWFQVYESRMRINSLAKSDKWNTWYLLWASYSKK